jgi:hypothetical protein
MHKTVVHGKQHRSSGTAYSMDRDHPDCLLECKIRFVVLCGKACKITKNGSS